MIAPIACDGEDRYLPASEEAWVVYSHRAWSITGDIRMSREKITFGSGVASDLRYLGSYQIPAKDKTPAACAAIYAFEPSFTTTLVNGNRLCGEHEEVGAAHPALYLAAFIDPPRWKSEPPALVLWAFEVTDASPGDTGLPERAFCGSTAYARPGQ